MRFIRPDRWVVQPPYPVEPDFGGSLAQAIGLKLAWSATAPGWKWTTKGASAATAVIAGRSAGSSGQTQGPVLGVSTVKASSHYVDLGPLAAGDTECTLLAVFRSSDINSFCVSSRASASTGVEFLTGPSSVADSVMFRVAPGTESATAALATNAGKYNVAVGSYRTGTVAKAHVNHLRSTGGASPTGGITHSQNLYIARRTTTYHTGDTALVLYGNRLDEDAARELVVNPWQLFKPRRSVVFSFGQAAAVSGDITAAGSLSVTGAADLDATGALLAAGSLSVTGAADLDAAGTLAAAGALSLAGAADLDAIGRLLAGGSIFVTGAADLGAPGTLAAAGALSISGVATLDVVAQLLAAGSIYITGAADLDATGSLLAIGALSISGAAAISNANATTFSVYVWERVA